MWCRTGAGTTCGTTPERFMHGSTGTTCGAGLGRAPQLVPERVRHHAHKIQACAGPRPALHVVPDTVRHQAQKIHVWIFRVVWRRTGAGTTWCRSPAPSPKRFMHESFETCGAGPGPAPHVVPARVQHHAEKDSCMNLPANVVPEWGRHHT